MDVVKDGRARRALVLCGTFPSRVDPTRGIFVKERIKAVSQLDDWEVRVLAPVPWFPPLKQFPQWYPWSKYPHRETVDGVLVDHPRYPLLPRVGSHFHPTLMYSAARRAADRIRDEFPFDLIDAHFVYPNGVVAAKLGQRYGVPVVMTGRGGDILVFPNQRLKSGSIRWALRHGTQFVAVSREIALEMRRLGAPRDRVHVIPNGVDTDRFRPLNQGECRQQLGLPAGGKIILSIGDGIELKGFHLLVDSLPSVREVHPDTRLVIVGGPGRHGGDYTREIERRIRTHGLEHRVQLVGARPHDELPLWHGAADVFAFLSSREGSPNVLLEALSSGLPAVATGVGGIVDELQDERLGILLAERCVPAAVQGICAVLARNTDRNVIHQIMGKRHWSATAAEVSGVFELALRAPSGDARRRHHGSQVAEV